MYMGKITESSKKQEIFHTDKKMILPQKSDSSGVSSAKKQSEEEERGVVLEVSENLKKMYEEQLEAAKEAAEAAGEGMKDLAKIMEIARRISNGDKVPPSDEKKLMEFDSDLYQCAKAAAALHADEKHKEYDSLFEEENQQPDEQVRELRREKSSRNENQSEAAAAEEISGGEEE